MYQFGPIHHSPTASPHLGALPLASTASVAQMVPSLVMAASAANELQSLMPLTNGFGIESEIGVSSSTLNDKYFHNPQGRPQWQSLPTNTIDPLLQDHGRDQVASKTDSLARHSSHPRPIAINPNGTQTHFTTDFSVSQKPVKPKVRGRFSDSRRKEVQEVRKRGACIRCRMLKKPVGLPSKGAMLQMLMCKVFRGQSVQHLRECGERKTLETALYTHPNCGRVQPLFCWTPQRPSIPRRESSPSANPACPAARAYRSDALSRFCCICDFCSTKMPERSGIRH